MNIIVSGTDMCGEPSPGIPFSHSIFLSFIVIGSACVLITIYGIYFAEIRFHDFAFWKISQN